MPKFSLNADPRIVIETTLEKAEAYNKLTQLPPNKNPLEIKEPWVVKALTVKNKLNQKVIEIHGTMFGNELRGTLIEN